MTNFETLKGKVLKQIFVADDKESMRFYTEDNKEYLLYHFQDCCETVQIEEIHGDLSDLIGREILLAEEVEEDSEVSEYQQYTFYKLATIKGSVTIRWLGESNGYYSVSVSFKKVR